MSWVREHDGELGDVKVSLLDDRQYRELHALRQWLARERPGPAGIFERSEIILVTYPTVRGPRSLRAVTLERFIELGLVRELSSYSARELELMREDGRSAYVQAADSIAFGARSELRCNRWEAYVPPLDATRNERQARYRATREERRRRDELEGNGVTASVMVPSAYARPVPSRPKTSDRAGDPATTERLLALLATDETRADLIRGLASRTPAGELEDLLRIVGTGEAADPVGYVIGRLTVASAGGI